MTTLDVGHRIDRYTIEAAIGEGGMGRVFRAHDERLDRRVALKLVSSAPGEPHDDEARQRLVREARAVSRLDHPNVVAVFDVGDSEHGPYIVMELVAGRSLRAVVDAGDMPMGERLRVLREIAQALAAAHEAGIVHRDVKPENVIVRPDGRVKVLDFGIARAAARAVEGDAATGPGLATLTTKGAALGTPRYMAPEQIKGIAVDGRTDQFGWGVLAHELLEGTTPFAGRDAMAVMASVLTDDPPPMRAAPAGVGAVVRRALEKDPARRFSSMHDLLAALDGAESPLPRAEASPRPPTASPAEAPRPAARPLPPPQLSRRWSGKELEEIFDRALAVQRTGYGHGEIVAAAREIGVDDAALERAMRGLEKRSVVTSRPTPRGSELRGLYRHAGIWLAVSFGLFLMNVFDPTSVWWFQWTMISWGIAVAIHAVVALTRGPDTPRLGRRSKDVVLEADAERVAAFLTARRSTKERPRVRVAPAPEGPDPLEADPLLSDPLDAELEELAAAELRAPAPRARG